MTTAVNDFLGDDAFSTGDDPWARASARPESSQARTPDVGRNAYDRLHMASAPSSHTSGHQRQFTAMNETTASDTNSSASSGRSACWRWPPSCSCEVLFVE